ncbi:MAG: DinB family protein [Vicinamibacteria bacterium]|nr:DinB family protein [Vicinamibacteria bacterium]
MSHLKAGFEEMETAKASLLKSIALLDDATLNRRPDPAAWSILQVVAHLTKSEAATLQYIKKKTQDPAALPKTGIVTWFRIAALVAGIHSPMKFKAPKATADVPESGDFQAASLAWAEVREDWREYIEAFPEVLNHRVIFRHPFVGLLGPAQVMIFLNQHLGNHVRQIGRIRKALDVQHG